ncbi:MAG: SelB C-terminal domain-containing protein, partial [Myxococcales bacterium]|nr:SelB C-terminal domain-containing protein [Myxococcales bacterium]
VLSGSDGPAKLLALIEDAEAAGIDGESLAIRSGVEAPGRMLARMTGTGGPVLALGSGEARRYVSRSLLEPLVRQAVAEADRFHGAHPLQPGIGRATLERTLAVQGGLATVVVDTALERGLLRVADRSGSMARPGKGALDPDDLPTALQEVVDLYMRGGMTPPTLRQVGDGLGLENREVLERVGLLQRSGLLIKVSDDLSYLPKTHEALLTGVREHLAAHGEIDVQALKGLTGLSRKFVVPLMEHLDHLGVTRREGDRRLPGPKAVP